MRNLRRLASTITRLLAGLSVISLATSVQADPTVQDFSAIFPPDAGACANPVPLQPLNEVSILPYWDGQGVQLTDDIGSLNTGVALNQLVSGAYQRLDIDFQFQMNNFAGTGGADGIGFAYANVTGDWGATNCGLFPDWGAGEEPSIAGSLGVGFDNYNNGAGDDNAENSISLHWNGNLLANAGLTDFDDPLFLESGDVIQASVSIVPGDGGSNVSVTLVDLDTGDQFVAYDNYRVDGLLPYDGRPVFKARTGGASLEQAIDNVSVTLTPVGGGNPFSVLENFESYDEGVIDAGAVPPLPPNPPLVGGTPYTEFQGGPDPPVRLINDGPSDGPQPGHMQLTNRSGSLSNSIAFDKTSDKADSIQASFKLFMNGDADGTSFLVLDANQYGDDGELTGGFSEEPNLAGALGVGFDIYNNGATDSDSRNHVSLHWDGAQVGENIVFDAADFTLYNGQWNDVQVIATEVEGGMNVTLVITDGTDGEVFTPFVDEFIPGTSFPDGARAAFGARTGGASALQQIDDVYICWTGDCSLPGQRGDFNNDGILDAADIDALTAQSASGQNNAAYDLNGDAIVDVNDVNEWISASDIYNSYSGDANLDHEFSSSDLVTVLSAGKYELDEAAVWTQGDFNGDGRFDTSDLVTALSGGGYEVGPKAAVSAVPEPASATMLLLGSLMFVRRRRK